MDDHIFGHLKHNLLAEGEKIIDKLIGAVKTYNGILMVDYHVRTLNDDYFPGWGKSYVYLLEKITEDDDFYCDNPTNIARYWLTRNETLEDLSKDETSCINQPR